MTCQDSFHEVAFNISFWTRNISSARILFWRGVSWQRLQIQPNFLTYLIKSFLFQFPNLHVCSKCVPCLENGTHKTYFYYWRVLYGKWKVVRHLVLIQYLLNKDERVICPRLLVERRNDTTIYRKGSEMFSSKCE